jgi:hypothetical protein
MRCSQEFKCGDDIDETNKENGGDVETHFGRGLCHDLFPVLVKPCIDWLPLYCMRTLGIREEVNGTRGGGKAKSF